MSVAAKHVDCTKAPNGSNRENSAKTMNTFDVIKLILPAAAGSFIEFYEFGIFSYMSTEITENFYAGHGGSLATWGSFALTLAVRPLGGLFFGRLADRYGRKLAMQWTIALMLTTTLLQGCLPTFYCCGESWGWVGFALVLILRVLQGLSAGGELSTAAVFISEVVPRESLGLHLSWISLTGAFGAWSVASFVVFLFETALSKEQMLLWGWRLPYLSTVVPGMAILFARRYLKETPEFEEMLKERAEQTAQSSLEHGSDVASDKDVLRMLLKDYKLALLVGSLGTSTFGVLSFVPPLYGVSFIKQDYGLPANYVTLSEMINFLIPALLAPAVGLLVDKWGAGRVYGLSLFIGGVLAPGPFLYWISHVAQDQAIFTLFIGQALLGLCLALTTSVFLWVVELFPVHVRATGVSVTYNIGVGLFGGLGPFISDAGNKVIDPKGLLSAPAIYTIFFGVVSFLAVVGSRFLGKRGVMRVTHIRESPY